MMETKNLILNLSFSKLLTSTPILCELVKKVEELTKLNHIIANQLDPKLARHCRVQSYENGILTLCTHSPVWGHTLRFAQADLLSSLRSYPEWCGLKSIRSRVVPSTENNNSIIHNPNTFETHISNNANPSPNPKPNPTPKPKFTLNKKDAHMLQVTAEHVNSETLKQALLKLANRALINGYTSS